MRIKDADANLYSKKLEMALSENLKLKSTQGTSSDKQNDAYNETETAFLMRKYQEGKVVEEALKNQITLAANVKDQVSVCDYVRVYVVSVRPSVCVSAFLCTNVHVFPDAKGYVLPRGVW